MRTLYDTLIITNVTSSCICISIVALLEEVHRACYVRLSGATVCLTKVKIGNWPTRWTKFMPRPTCTLANKSLNEYGKSLSNEFYWEIHLYPFNMDFPGEPV